MRANEFLIERVVNLHTDAEKQQYRDAVWDIMQNSYAKLGGFGSAASPEELVSKTGLWKLIKRGSDITAACLYKDQHGRKSIASGTNGTRQGVKDYLHIKDEDVKFKRSWAEVSGKPEQIMANSGAKAIPAEFAAALTGKEILEYNPDGYHYTRLIAGHPHEKVIYGTVHLTPKLKHLLKSHGIHLHNLPDNMVDL